jgi:hypothetical protein
MFSLQINSQDAEGDVIEDALAIVAGEGAVLEYPPASDNILALNIGHHAVVTDSKSTSLEDYVSSAPTSGRKHAIEPEQVRRSCWILANILYISLPRSHR